MSEVFIKTNELPCWLADEYFYGKDIISIDELVATLEDVKDDLELVKEQFEDFKRDVRDNYRQLSIAEQVD